MALNVEELLEHSSLVRPCHGERLSGDAVSIGATSLYEPETEDAAYDALQAIAADTDADQQPESTNVTDELVPVSEFPEPINQVLTEAAIVANGKI